MYVTTVFSLSYKQFIKVFYIITATTNIYLYVFFMFLYASHST
uniref:Uncharacterized protein n=1 Tax=CrAss-like virus sp. ctRQZ5 TaxID=2826824 RepID=A0A8S5LXU8_9CAUD|nr:MAG TPA: hypothetical protein [CrAss-like virus sp. ctRQZ5]DAR21059.1 MAG TPA: hypothetical protein [Caudoviricetes sp.]